MNKTIFSGTSYILLCAVFVFSQKECFRLYSGGLKPFCCDNYVRKNGECIECKQGTKSKNEEPCTPCNTGTYGRKCTFFCKCSFYERCDRVSGCTVDTKLITTGHENSIQTEVNQYTFNTNRDVTEEEKYVYFTGFGGFLLIILSAVCIYVCFRKYKSKQLENNHITEPDNNQSNEESSTENVYEIIDESSIFDESIPSTNPAESIEDVKNSQSGSETSSINSGYLNPYTTFTERNETHVYCTRIHTNNSSSSLSSLSSSLRRDSGYTHPYELLQTGHIESKILQKINCTVIPTDHYSKLSNVPKNADGVIQSQILNWQNKKRNICISHRYSDNSNAYVQPLGHSPLARFASVQLHTSSHINNKELKAVLMNPAAKRASV